MVVDSSGTIYGHLVAGDLGNGIGYAIPAFQSFENMKLQTGYDLSLLQPRPEVLETSSASETRTHDKSKRSPQTTPLSSLEKANVELQARFESEMKDVTKTRTHSRVAVLFLSWEKEAPDYVDTAEEVSHIPATCKHIY